MKKLVKKIVFVINVLLAISLLLAYLAPFINPSKFILPALFGLAYPYILLINLMFMFYYLIRFKKELLISLVIILLGWNHLNNLIPIRLNRNNPLTDTENVNQVKLISYNVRAFNMYNWSKEPNAKEEIFNFISGQEPDIICLQEYFTTLKPGSTEEDIDLKFHKTPYKSIYYSFEKKRGSRWGIATYSKYPIIKRSRIPFDNSVNGAMYTDLLIQGDTIRVFNIHLQSISFREKNYAFIDTIKLKYSDEQIAEFRDIGSHLKQAFIQRSEQATIISNYIKKSPYPVILTGDFNDTPVSFAYRKIKKGLYDAFRKSGKGFGNTYSGELPSFRIDFILFSDPLQSSEFKRFKTKFSDHYPIQATIDLSE